MSKLHVFLPFLAALIFAHLARRADAIFALPFAESLPRRLRVELVPAYTLANAKTAASRLSAVEGKV